MNHGLKPLPIIQTLRKRSTIMIYIGNSWQTVNGEFSRLSKIRKGKDIIKYCTTNEQASLVVLVQALAS